MKWNLKDQQSNKKNIQLTGCCPGNDLRDPGVTKEHKSEENNKTMRVPKEKWAENPRIPQKVCPQKGFESTFIPHVEACFGINCGHFLHLQGLLNSQTNKVFILILQADSLEL